MKQLDECLLYGILDLGYCREGDLPRTAEMMADGGVDILQLRAKGHASQDILRMARGLAPLLRERELPFILNDHPRLVAEAGCDGVHVGQDDTPVAAARRNQSGGVIVGKSTHSLSQVHAARDERPDYIGFGPLFATPTKPDYQAIGLDTIRAAQQAADCPVFCIGGVNADTLDTVIGHGALRVVVVSGILLAPDVRVFCRDLKDRLVANHARHLAAAKAG